MLNSEGLFFIAGKQKNIERKQTNKETKANKPNKQTKLDISSRSDMFLVAWITIMKN